MQPGLNPEATRLQDKVGFLLHFKPLIDKVGECDKQSLPLIARNEHQPPEL